MIMTEHLDTIPDDLPTCQERLRAVLERLRHLERLLHDLECQLDETCATTEELQRSYACLKEEYLTLKRMLFGPRRERLPEDPGQEHLFDMAPAASVPPEPADDDPGESRPRSAAKATVGVPSLTIYHDETSPMTCQRRSARAVAAARRRRSART